ncbi:MAG TPA: four helix bundle protein [Bacteroidales bacterium]|nr:four helix bundle protein [Bacteroidales bacterium]
MSEFESILYNKSHLFAVEVVKFYQNNYQIKYSDIYKQLLKSATSIGANMAEANGALTGNDFSSKVSIAYKEMLESQYWLLLFKDTNLIDNDLYLKLNNQVNELCKIAFSILKTTGRIRPKS